LSEQEVDLVPVLRSGGQRFPRLATHSLDKKITTQFPSLILKTMKQQ